MILVLGEYHVSKRKNVTSSHHSQAEFTDYGSHEPDEKGKNPPHSGGCFR